MTLAALMFLVGGLAGFIAGCIVGWASALSDVSRWPRPRLDDQSTSEMSEMREKLRLVQDERE